MDCIEDDLRWIVVGFNKLTNKLEGRSKAIQRKGLPRLEIPKTKNIASQIEVPQCGYCCFM